MKISRRKFIKTSLVATAACLNVNSLRNLSAVEPQATGFVLVCLVKNGGLKKEDHYCALIDIESEEIIMTVPAFQAGHAVTPIESLNRMVVHGKDLNTGRAALFVLEVDPQNKSAKKVFNREFDGGLLLHWQPNADHSEIVFNSIGDGKLHVMQTDTFDIQTFSGGGAHSNMVLSDRYIMATDKIHGKTYFSIIDRKSAKVLSHVYVGKWAHGVTYSREYGKAFIWNQKDTVSVVSLAEKEFGTVRAVISPFASRERSWFCWTPQGGRYSHDTAWLPGDKYSHYIMVLDMKENKLEQIQTPGFNPQVLQISPDGKQGLASVYQSNKILHIDIEGNKILGAVEVGQPGRGFFDRDLAFCRDRRIGIIGNPGEQSLSVVDLEIKKELKRIKLDALPVWHKAL